MTEEAGGSGAAYMPSVEITEHPLVLVVRSALGPGREEEVQAVVIAVLDYQKDL